jgi:hypothetical protein
MALTVNISLGEHPMKARFIFLAAVLLCLGAPASADTYVKGYTKQDGTYVAPHYRSSPNNTPMDN